MSCTFRFMMDNVLLRKRKHIPYHFTWATITYKMDQLCCETLRELEAGKSDD